MKYMGGCMQVIQQHILYQGLEHSQILVSVGGPGTKPQQDTKGQLIALKLWLGLNSFKNNQNITLLLLLLILIFLKGMAQYIKGHVSILPCYQLFWKLIQSKNTKEVISTKLFPPTPQICFKITKSLKQPGRLTIREKHSY